jgi:hypothetical protein
MIGMYKAIEQTCWQAMATAEKVAKGEGKKGVKT